MLAKQSTLSTSQPRSQGLSLLSRNERPWKRGCPLASHAVIFRGDRISLLPLKTTACETNCPLDSEFIRRMLDSVSQVLSQLLNKQVLQVSQ